MDSIDRDVYILWDTDLNGWSFQVKETLGRKSVKIFFRGNEGVASVRNLEAMIRILSEAKNRLEGLAAMEGLEKIVP